MFGRDIINTAIYLDSGLRKCYSTDDISFLIKKLYAVRKAVERLFFFGIAVDVEMFRIELWFVAFKANLNY